MCGPWIGSRNERLHVVEDVETLGAETFAEWEIEVLIVTAGYQVRTRLVKSLRQPDFNIALLEDLVAIGGSLFIVSRF